MAEETRRGDVPSAGEASGWSKSPKVTFCELCVDREIPSAMAGRRWRSHRAALHRQLPTKTQCESHVVRQALPQWLC